MTKFITADLQIDHNDASDELIAAPSDPSKLHTLASEHVERASTTVGIFEPIHKKTGRTKPRDLQHKQFLPHRPSQYCP